MSAAKRPELVALLAEAVMQMCVGEIRQQAMRYRYRIAVDEYMRRIELKTARLMALCCTTGAILGGLDETGESALATYGLALGLAFQIADDVLDYIGEPGDVGKPVGGDLIEGHSTLPLLLALDVPATAERISRVLQDGAPVQQAQLPVVLAAVRDDGAPERALEQARSHAAEARAALHRFPDSPARQALTELTEYVVARDV
jgi:geranylgeranyl pyrophosphate synthase